MKRYAGLILLSIATTFFTVKAQVQEETRQLVFTSATKGSPFIIQPNQAYNAEVTFTEKGIPVRRFLRVVGGTMLPGKFKERGETLFREAEFLIDNHLDSVNRYKDKYALYFQGENNPYEQYAYNRVSVPEIKPGKLTIELPVKRSKVNIAGDGFLGLELELYYNKEGRHQDEVYDKPDSILYMPVKAGNGRFRVMKQDFELPENIAAILVRTGGISFSGECWMEAPRFIQSGEEVWHKPFVFHNQRGEDYNYWVGVNLVSQSWPMWKIDFNGKTLFSGRVFDRASNIADFYIPLPENLTGTGNLNLTLLKESHKAAFPYQMERLEILEETARDFEIASVPRFVAVGDTAGILMEINKPGVRLEALSDATIRFLNPNLSFGNAGLHVIQFVALAPAINIPVTISDGTDIRKAVIQQTVIKDKDCVYLSSGDEIHIDKEYSPYNYFFKWYIRERVGNWYQFRPSYQWSGVRITRDDVIRHYTGLLNQLHIPYAWQVEGRTLASTRINPSKKTLESPMFRGKQAHENDGGYYYWQHFNYTGLHSDMAARTRPYGGIFAKHRPIYTDHGIFIHYDPYGVTDMADGANKLIANLSYSRGESTRHTGPSTAFRYLYQAGYDWVGAEQMYGPEDIIMSALRGASQAYRKKNFGSLHAVQWGSFPFTDPKHAKRFYLSLAVAYMHGSSHINTEEGLWTDEYANDRFSQSGKEHMEAQHNILDYIETHSRKGDLHTPIAVIQGRNDAWKSFGRQYAWSQKDEKWKFGKALESFDLLNVFYPENIVDGCGPEGWFTSTPYGAVDIVPIEASNDVLDQYKLLVFLGWNSFDNADFIRIRKYVERGGMLLLTAAHLNSELQPDAPVRFPANDTVIKGLLGLDYKSYTERTVIPLGKGTIVYYPQETYPADESIRAVYEASMRELAEKAIAGEDVKGWIAASPSIDFTVWDAANLRTIYALNVDWDNDLRHEATFLLNDKKFTIQINPQMIHTIRCSYKLAVMPAGNTSDIISIKDKGDKWLVTCQTTTGDSFLILNGLNGSTETREFPSAGIFDFEVMKETNDLR